MLPSGPSSVEPVRTSQVSKSIFLKSAPDNWVSNGTSTNDYVNQDVYNRAGEPDSRDDLWGSHGTRSGGCSARAVQARLRTPVHAPCRGYCQYQSRRARTLAVTTRSKLSNDIEEIGYGQPIRGTLSTGLILLRPVLAGKPVEHRGGADSGAGLGQP